MTEGESLTVDQAMAAIGNDGRAIHIMATDPEGNGHLTISRMDRQVFECIVKTPTCKLSIAEKRLIDLKYPLRVETTQRTFYVFCHHSPASERHLTDQ